MAKSSVTICIKDKSGKIVEYFDDLNTAYEACRALNRRAGTWIYSVCCI